MSIPIEYATKRHWQQKQAASRLSVNVLFSKCSGICFSHCRYSERKIDFLEKQRVLESATPGACNIYSLFHNFAIKRVFYFLSYFNFIVFKRKASTRNSNTVKLLLFT